MITDKKNVPKVSDNKKDTFNKTDIKRKKNSQTEKFSPGEPDDYNAEEFSTD